MSKIQTLQQEWKNFFRAKEQAEKDGENEFKRRQDEINEAQKKLTAERKQWIKDFRDEWNEKKRQIQHDRDEAIIERLMQGDSQASIMKELGTSNTVLLSELAQVARERQNQGIKVASQPADRWLWHSHTGVHGWLLSQDGTRFKMYDPAFDPEDGGEPEYFIGDAETLSYVGGSKELYLRTAPRELMMRSEMLKELLAGTYSGKVVEAKNPYTA